MSKPPAPAWRTRPRDPWSSPQACSGGFDTPWARSSPTATQPAGTGFPRRAAPATKEPARVETSRAGVANLTTGSVVKSTGIVRRFRHAVGSFLADGYSGQRERGSRRSGSAGDVGAGACRNLPRRRGELDHGIRGQVHRHSQEVSTRRGLVPRRRLLGPAGTGFPPVGQRPRRRSRRVSKPPAPAWPARPPEPWPSPRA